MKPRQTKATKSRLRKEPVPANLVALAAEIERQIGQEPEVETARADLTEDASGILTVQVRITLKKTGQQVDVSYAPGVRL